ncbi:MAG TPA: hypothetical protein VFU35_00015 [Jatrophihabitans sp.]|nr:hypothetical protein [Jatrophihabitans sp.]
MPHYRAGVVARGGEFGPPLYLGAAFHAPNWTAFADGTLVVDRPGRNGTRALIAVSPSGTNRTLLTLPAGQAVDVLEAAADWAVVTYFAEDAPSQHAIRYTATVAVNVRTGAGTVIAGRGATVTDLPAGFGIAASRSFDVDRTGTVWYAAGAPSRPVLHRYDLRTGRSETVARAPGGHRQAPGVGVGLDGVYWQYPGKADTDAGAAVLAAALPLPRPVAAAYGHRSVATLTSDGRAYAWTTGTELSWWQPGMRAPKRVDLSDADDHTAGVDTVAGPIVSAASGAEANGRTVIDMRTGSYVLNPQITSGGDVQTTPGRWYFQTYDDDARAATIHAISSALPRLHC